jgi:hypothetical protein
MPESYSLIPSLLLNVTGGAVALWADRQFPDYSIDIGPVTIKTGALGGLALAGLLVLVPGFPAHSFLSALATGAVAYEAVGIAETHIVPTLEQWISDKTKALGNGKAANGNAAKVKGCAQPQVGAAPQQQQHFGQPALTSAMHFWRQRRAAA